MQPSIKWKPLLISVFLTAALVWLGMSNAARINELLPGFLGNLPGVRSLAAEGYEKLGGLLEILIALGIPSAAFASLRRVRTKGRVELGNYFDAPDFTRYPADRKGYSDRLSYTLAELADLAYWDVFTDEELAGLTAVSDAALEERADPRSAIIAAAKLVLRNERRLTRAQFDEVLAKGGFTCIDHNIRSDATQCFVCAHGGMGEAAEGETNRPYLVVAFRGSEKDIDDWLTNVDAAPASEFTLGAVHQGFYTAYRSVQAEVLAAIRQGKEQFGEDTPVFFCGHSLGGALAVVATRLNAQDSNGACYTFGCPRVGAYDFFKGMKTPVYRVVNASDLVPRVPPGAWSYLLLKLLDFLAFITVRVEALSMLVKAVRGWVDRIDDYRHYGDMRFLPDIPSAGISDRSEQRRNLKVLNNPNHMDMVQWFYRHLAVSFGMPVRSHSMKLYRNKLLDVARTRMTPLQLDEPQI